MVCGVAMASAWGASGQELAWSVDFNTIFDNREGDERYTEAKTFFQTQLSPEIGLWMMGGTHRLMGGVVWTQPIGSEWRGYKVSPTLYYRYDGGGRWAFSMGMFPRTQLQEALPNYIWNDSIYYCQRNIRGLMVQYRGDAGRAEMVVDWRGMQTKRQREAFNVIAQGRYQREGSVWFAGGLAMLNHFALASGSDTTQYIVDNIMVNPYVGLDLGGRIGTDTLTVKAGPLTGIVRNREYGKWKAPTGMWLEGLWRWRWLGVREMLYLGQRLFPYYRQHGWLLDQGEPYLQSKYYWRTDLYGYIMSNEFMDLRASLTFNVAEHNFSFYQRLILRVYLDGRMFGRRKGRHISNFY